MLPITKNLIIRNFYQNENTHDYIVIHDTGNRDGGSNAVANRNYFNTIEAQSSAHYIVDDKTILLAVAEKDGAWHCGDGAGMYGINNRNSIGIEICVNTDGCYQSALQNTKDLVISLLLKYNLKPSAIVRHFDASKKNCPASMNADGKWTAWQVFKEDLTLQYAVAKLVQKGVISSPDYWLDPKNTTTYKGDYVRTLLKNLANIL